MDVLVSPRLIAAAFVGNDKIVEKLLAHKARPERAGYDWQNGYNLCRRTRIRRHRASLLDAGVDANAHYGNELTALMWAAGHDEGVGAIASSASLILLLTHGGGARRCRQSRPHRADDRYDSAMPTSWSILSAAAPIARKRTTTAKTALDLAANGAVREKLTAQ